MASEVEIRDLVAPLGAADARTSRAAGEALLRHGAAALPALVAALRGGNHEARKAAAFLLGRLPGTAETATALATALADVEPKVRKNAAVSLGRKGGPGEVAAAAAALEGETVAWVRPSLVLALGSLGGDAARSALAGLAPQSAAEEEALAKAMDHLNRGAGTPADPGARPAVSWREASELASAVVFASAPPGLEDLAQAEAVERGLAAPEVSARGLLQFSPGTRPAGLQARLRCVSEVRLLLAQGPPLPRSASRELAGGVIRLLAPAGPLQSWRSWLDTGGEPLRYRFAVEGLRLPKSAFRDLLGAVRHTLAPLGLVDSPSNYAVQLVLEAAADGSRLWLLPSFETDLRFAYRRLDVGAAIHPVVAACLARLVRTPAGDDAQGSVLDPTCGSGTLLIERALLSDDVLLRGIDVSPTAVAAAQQNVEAAGLGGRISIERRDAADPASWRPVREVLANLPFGLRTRSQDRGLDALYARLVGHLGRSLAPGGRAVLYTANARALEPALVRAAPALRVVEKRRVSAGGLEVGVWVIERAESLR